MANQGTTDRRTVEARQATANLVAALERKLAQQRLSYTVAGFGAATGIGRTSIFAAIKDGRLKSTFVSGRRLILAEDAEAFLRAGREGDQ